MRVNRERIVDSAAGAFGQNTWVALGAWGEARAHPNGDGHTQCSVGVSKHPRAPVALPHPRVTKHTQNNVGKGTDTWQRTPTSPSHPTFNTPAQALDLLQATRFQRATAHARRAPPHLDGGAVHAEQSHVHAVAVSGLHHPGYGGTVVEAVPTHSPRTHAVSMTAQTSPPSPPPQPMQGGQARGGGKGVINKEGETRLPPPEGSARRTRCHADRAPRACTHTRP
jgi:hypothetical protein